MIGVEAVKFDSNEVNCAKPSFRLYILCNTKLVSFNFFDPSLWQFGNFGIIVKHISGQSLNRAKVSIKLGLHIITVLFSFDCFRLLCFATFQPRLAMGIDFSFTLDFIFFLVCFQDYMFYFVDFYILIRSAQNIVYIIQTTQSTILYSCKLIPNYGMH